jgi:hypothetical protein
VILVSASATEWGEPTMRVHVSYLAAVRAGLRVIANRQHALRCFECGVAARTGAEILRLLTFDQPRTYGGLRERHRIFLTAPASSPPAAAAPLKGGVGSFLLRGVLP